MFFLGMLAGIFGLMMIVFPSIDILYLESICFHKSGCIVMIFRACTDRRPQQPISPRIFKATCRGGLTVYCAARDRSGVTEIASSHVGDTLQRYGIDGFCPRLC